VGGGAGRREISSTGIQQKNELVNKEDCRGCQIRGGEGGVTRKDWKWVQNGDRRGDGKRRRKKRDW